MFSNGSVVQKARKNDGRLARRSSRGLGRGDGRRRGAEGFRCGEERPGRGTIGARHPRTSRQSEQQPAENDAVLRCRHPVNRTGRPGVPRPDARPHRAQCGRQKGIVLPLGLGFAPGHPGHRLFERGGRVPARAALRAVGPGRRHHLARVARRAVARRPDAPATRRGPARGSHAQRLERHHRGRQPDEGLPRDGSQVGHTGFLPPKRSAASQQAIITPATSCVNFSLITRPRRCRQRFRCWQCPPS